MKPLKFGDDESDSSYFYGGLLNFFQTHDWEGDYSWHDQEQKTFVKKAKQVLKRQVSEEIAGLSAKENLSTKPIP